jgi:hypothetical protein
VRRSLRPWSKTRGDESKALALAEVLLARSDADDEFRRALENWWQQAEPIRASTGNVTNTISGRAFHGPVLQGRDIRNITFGERPPVPAVSVRVGFEQGGSDSGLTTGSTLLCFSGVFEVAQHDVFIVLVANLAEDGGGILAGRDGLIESARSPRCRAEVGQRQA